MTFSGGFFFFFNDTATTEIYTLSLHDALPIYVADGLSYFDHTVACDVVAVDVDAKDPSVGVSCPQIGRAHV